MCVVSEGSPRIRGRKDEWIESYKETDQREAELEEATNLHLFQWEIRAGIYSRSRLWENLMVRIRGFVPPFEEKVKVEET